MKPLLALVISSLLIAGSQAMERPSFHTKGMPTGKPTGLMKPGEYWWQPELSPSGPVTVLVSIPQQTMHVYRNGILIGRSTVSTGSTNHTTPAGVFSILEKKQEHRSKKYDNAPMPNMQRLTWSGIAMHSGNLPGYPASHGCVRLPYDFSQLLFRATERGGTVVIGDGRTPTPHLAANPGMVLAPTDFSPAMLRPLAQDDYEWQPERSTSGPVTIAVSTADQALYVYRNGNPIGRAAITVSSSGLFGGSKKLGEHVFTMLEGDGIKPSWWTPGRAARKWLRVTHDGRRVDPDDLAKRVHFSPQFATKLYDVAAPGTTVIVTDQPVVRKPTQTPVFVH